MPEFRRYPKGTSRQIIDLNQIQDVMGDEVIICLDIGLLAIIRKLLVDRGLWRTTYAVSNDQFGYSIPTEEEFHSVKQLILTFLEETQNMSTCGEDIKAGLEAIASAILNKRCCPSGGIGGTGTGGAGGTGSPPSETETGTPGQHEGDPPTGFETWEDYDQYKCAVATQIVSDWQADLVRLQKVIFTAALSTEAIAALVGLSILSPIPGDEIIVIVGITIAAITVGLVSEAFEAAAAVIDAKASDLICVLFNAPDVASIRSDASSVIDEGISEEGITGFPVSFVKQIAQSYLNPDNLNRLFDKDTTRGYDLADCSGCLEETCLPDLPIEVGTIESVVDNQDGTYTYTLVSDVDPEYTFRQAIKWGWVVPGETGGCAWQWLEGTESIVGDQSGWGAFFWYCDGTVQQRYNINDTTFTGIWRHAKMWHSSEVQFKYVVTMTGAACA